MDNKCKNKQENVWLNAYGFCLSCPHDKTIDVALGIIVVHELRLILCHE